MGGNNRLRELTMWRGRSVKEKGTIDDSWKIKNKERPDYEQTFVGRERPPNYHPCDIQPK